MSAHRPVLTLLVVGALVFGLVAVLASVSRGPACRPVPQEPRWVACGEDGR